MDQVKFASAVVLITPNISSGETSDKDFSEPAVTELSISSNASATILRVSGKVDSKDVFISFKQATNSFDNFSNSGLLI